MSPVDPSFTLSGQKPKLLFSQYLEREFEHLESFHKDFNVGDDVVLLAAGPSLPASPVWSSRKYPVWGLNRAVLSHRLDAWVGTTDILVLDGLLLSALLSSVSEDAIIFITNYAVEPRCNEERIKNVREAARLFSKIKNRIVLYDAIGMRVFEKTKNYEQLRRRGCVFGHRSVCTGAIEILRLLGAQRIHLFGHDAARRGKKRYCCESITSPQTNQQFDYAIFRMLSGMRMASNLLWNQISIFNYCKNSNSPLFKKYEDMEFPANEKSLERT